VIRILAACLALLMACLPAAAHELRPAYLDLRETAPGVYAVVWKSPARGDRRLGISPRLPDVCTPNGEPQRAIESNAYFERLTITCSVPLKGQMIGVDGLGATYTDALLRIAYLDGAVETARLTPETAFTEVKGAQSALEVALTYFTLGVEHILEGVDHLLFVFALLLLVKDWRSLVKAVTAFTVAHSITLTGATLGYLSLPQAPVEAIIALSVVFVAREIIMGGRGQGGLSGLMPWTMAFAFGLLHGFGFAGALREVGLPQSDVPLALLSFNLGVEAGQLAFVAAVLLPASLARFMFKLEPRRYAMTAAYAIGAIAMVWFIERMTTLI
jgi:hydrogenase/urease accessory protein HupE